MYKCKYCGSIYKNFKTNCSNCGGSILKLSKMSSEGFICDPFNNCNRLKILKYKDEIKKRNNLHSSYTTTTGDLEYISNSSGNIYTVNNNKGEEELLNILENKLLNESIII